jgi:hypothetical protein
MSYSPNYVELTRLAATYVDKILTGAKPADLPVSRRPGSSKTSRQAGAKHSHATAALRPTSYLICQKPPPMLKSC